MTPADPADPDPELTGSKLAARWVTINGRLAALGIVVQDAGNPAALTREPSLSPHQWERLLVIRARP